MANSRQYTDEELIQRVWDVEEIKKLIHKRVIYIANEMRKEELNDLWVQNPEHKKTASFGRNTGYYTGMDAIHDYYVVHHQKEREKQLKKLHAANPAIADIPQNLHIGCLSSHPVSTGLVELAGDGKTAKGLWYSIAQETEAQPDGTGKALWMPTERSACSSAVRKRMAGKSGISLFLLIWSAKRVKIILNRKYIITMRRILLMWSLAHRRLQS